MGRISYLTFGIKFGIILYFVYVIENVFQQGILTRQTYSQTDLFTNNIQCTYCQVAACQQTITKSNLMMCLKYYR